MKLEAVERHDCPAGSCDRAIRCAGCQGDGTLLVVRGRLVQRDPYNFNPYTGEAMFVIEEAP